MRKQIVDENFITGVPTYLTFDRVERGTQSVVNGNYELTTLEGVANPTIFARTNYTVDPTKHKKIKLTFYDVYLNTFNEITHYFGLYESINNNMRFQFSHTGTNAPTIRFYRVLGGVSEGEVLAYSLPLTPDKPMTFEIEYDIQKGFVDVFIEGSRYRYTTNLVNVPMTVELGNLQSRDGLVKTFGMSGYKLELE